MTKTITTAEFKGQTVTVGETTKGWIAVTFADGTTGKARAKDLSNIQEIAVESSRKNGVVNPDYLGNYNKVVLADGTVVRDNGDDAAEMLRGTELDGAYKLVAKKIGMSVDDLKTAYAHLNNGMQRMALGNRLRKALRDADKAHAAAK